MLIAHLTSPEWVTVLIGFAAGVVMGVAAGIGIGVSLKRTKRM